MSSISIISISNTKRNPHIDKTNEYIKWINKYLNIELIDLDIRNEQNYSKETIKLFNKYINNSHANYLLDAEGNEFNTSDFSSKIINNNLVNSKNIYFFIAGAYGLDKEDKSLFNNVISLSMLTLPHDMAKLVLAEQIYRSITIINNIKYNY